MGPHFLCRRGPFSLNQIELEIFVTSLLTSTISGSLVHGVHGMSFAMKINLLRTNQRPMSALK